MKKVFLIFSILFGLQLSGTCQTEPAKNDEQILEVEYHITGTEMGGELSFKISKDSIKYFSLGTFDSNYNYKNNGDSDGKRTDTLFWKKLISSINLSDFDNAPNAKAVSSIDGIDRILRIKTTKTTHGIVLTNNRKDYAKLKVSIDLISGELKKYKVALFW